MSPYTGITTTEDPHIIMRCPTCRAQMSSNLDGDRRLGELLLALCNFRDIHKQCRASKEASTDRSTPKRPGPLGRK